MSYMDEELTNGYRVLPPVPRPFDYSLLLDTKVVAEGHVRGMDDLIHVSPAFLDVLESFPNARFRASPVAHGTPLSVRGRTLYGVELPGFVGRLDASVKMFSRFKARKGSLGHAGAPVSPVSFDGSSWTGDPVCWSEWFDTTNPMSGWRALVACGPFVKALLSTTPEPRVIVEPVDVHSLPEAPFVERSIQWQRAAATPNTDAPSLDALVARLQRSAESYRHWFPPAPSLETLARTLEALQAQVGGPLHPSLAMALSRLAGAGLFGGAIGILPCAERVGASALPRELAMRSPNDDILLANLDDRCAEQSIARPPGHVLFGWRTGHFPAFWSMNAAGAVHLLSTGRALLGPGVPFEQWLEDQIADLEYAWKYRDTLPFNVDDWLGEQVG